MINESSEQVFVVVEVQAGVVVGARCFSSFRNAEQRAEEARSQCDANDDDVQIFETTVEVAA